MGNIHDIVSLITKAEAMEKTDPAGAHAKYERAERGLNMHLFLIFGLTINDLEYGSSGVPEIYLTIFHSIKRAYGRLSAAKEEICLGV